MVSAVTDLTIEFLHEQEISTLFLDFDNTIIPYTTEEPMPEVEAWLAALGASSVTLCVLSNSKHDRVKHFCEARGIDYILRARKPFQRGIRAAKHRYGVSGREAALVGDQIYTDVLGANCGGLCSILVKPLRLHTIFLWLRHVLEQLWIAVGRVVIYYEEHRKNSKASA